ncbi:MAG: DUF456 domain-containing protein [Halobacteriales archaeon]
MVGVLAIGGTIDPIAVVAVALLIAGVVGCVVPIVPGAPLSLAGVYLYWWGTGFTEPGVALLAALTLLGLLATVADVGAEVVSARVGGASMTTSVVAGAVGIVLFVVVTPIGALLGVVATVFVLEYRRHRDATQGAKAAGAVVLGILGSVVVQVILTASMLVAFVAGVFL